MAIYFDLVVAYDIDDNRQRKEVYEQLRDLGLTPIQKSVFWGRVLPAEERAVRDCLRASIAAPNRAIVLKGSFAQQLRDHSCGYDHCAWETPSHVCI